MGRKRRRARPVHPLKKMRFAALLLALSAAVACERRATDPRVLRIALESFPTNLDPRLAADAYSYDVIETLYNGLLKPGAQGDYVPDLAESIERLEEEPPGFLVRLREGVRFHNGQELTASDVRCTYESVLDPNLNSPVRASFEPLGEIDVLGRYELRLVLKRPYAPFFESLTFPILPCVLLEKGHDFAAAPVGTGFLKFMERDSPSFVDLEPFADYFEGPSRLPPRVRFANLADPTTRVLSLIRGEIDVSVNNISALYVDYLRERGGLQIQTTPGTTFTYIGFNLRDEILGKPAVRKAIAHAVDRDELVRYRKRGLADSADSIFPKNHWAAFREAPRYDYDPDRARALLDEAGYPHPAGGGPRFRLLYKTSQNKDRLRMIAVIRQQLADVGVEIEVRPYEWGTFFDQIKRGEFQLYSLSWVGVNDPDFYYGVFHSRETPESGGRNRGRYANAEVDELLEQARATLDSDGRAELYRRMQRILVDELPYLPLWHERNVAVLSPRVQGFVLDTAASFRSLVGVHLVDPEEERR